MLKGCAPGRRDSALLNYTASLYFRGLDSRFSLWPVPLEAADVACPSLDAPTARRCAGAMRRCSSRRGVGHEPTSPAHDRRAGVGQQCIALLATGSETHQSSVPIGWGTSPAACQAVAPDRARQGRRPGSCRHTARARPGRGFGPVLPSLFRWLDGAERLGVAAFGVR